MVKDLFIFDMHGHGPGLLPEGSSLHSNSTPKDTAIGALKGCGLDACVLCAVGDPATFGFGTRNEYSGVRFQLAGLRTQLDACGGMVVTSPDQLAGSDLAATANTATAGTVPATVSTVPATVPTAAFGQPGVRGAKRAGGNGAGCGSGESSPFQALLGVEGLDFLDGNLDIIDDLYAEGVRLLGLVHYTSNALGGICMDLRGDPAGPGTAGGLTDFGAAVIARANALGMIVDVTHANDATILDAIVCSTRPVICSHTGPRAMSATPRYIPDSVLGAIAESGGLIGLWPEKMGATGPVDLAEFVRMAAHVVKVCGIDCVGLGTDFNGVPGYTAGYRGPVDIGKIAESLMACGFSHEECRAIMGGNALRFIAAAL